MFFCSFKEHNVVCKRIQKTKRRRRGGGGERKERERGKEGKFLGWLISVLVECCRIVVVVVVEAAEAAAARPEQPWKWDVDNALFYVFLTDTMNSSL